MQVGPKGKTFREHYQGLAKRGRATGARRTPGVVEARRELRKAADIPHELKYLHQWFLELDETRDYSEGVPGPLLYREMLDWMEAVDAWPAPHEVRALKRLDNIRRFAMLKHLKHTRNKPPAKKKDAGVDDVETFNPSPRKRLAAAKQARQVAVVEAPTTRRGRRT